MNPNSPNRESIELTTRLEHMLYERLIDEKQERKRMASLVEDLKSQIEILQKQLKCLAETNVSKPDLPTKELSGADVEYNTDEEELARETGWLRNKTRKKRKLNTSPTQDKADERNIEENVSKGKVPKIPLPPPIIVDGINDYQKFYDFLSDKQPADAFSIKMMSGDTVKINAVNEESYRAITKALSLNNCVFHSYENKQERPIRVMAKKLHATCQPERIIDDLKNKGFNIIEAVNKISWKTKEPLNMFMLTFANNEEINKIFGIKIIMGCKVEIQAIKSTKLVPQCKRCQAYGHTQRYCFKEPRCVKCTGKHLTKECQKSKDAKPKCVHCGAPHPANYRGCSIAKEIQLMRNKMTKKSVPVQQQKIHAQTKYMNPVSKPEIEVNKNISYAHVASKGIPKVPYAPTSTNSTDKKLDNIMNLMLSFDERLKIIENSTKSAKSRAA